MLRGGYGATQSCLVVSVAACETQPRACFVRLLCRLEWPFFLLGVPSFLLLSEQNVDVSSSRLVGQIPCCEKCVRAWRRALAVAEELAEMAAATVSGREEVRVRCCGVAVLRCCGVRCCGNGSCDCFGTRRGAVRCALCAVRCVLCAVRCVLCAVSCAVRLPSPPPTFLRPTAFTWIGRAQLGLCAEPRIPRRYPRRGRLCPEQMRVLLCPAFTRDVTGGLGVAVFALEPAEVALFDREELRAFALQHRSQWQGIRIGKVANAGSQLQKEAESVRRKFHRRIQNAKAQERRCLKRLVR